MSVCPTAPPVRVDAHHHFWPEPTPEKYPWMTDAQVAIRRPFLSRDLAPHLKARAIERTVLVQTRSALDETRELLAIAGLTDFVAGVVGWVDLTAPDVAETLTAVKSGPHGRWLVGVRHQAHDEPVACKLSGMVTEAGWQAWTPDDPRPYVERALIWFGEDRVMYGSDWRSASWRRRTSSSTTRSTRSRPT